MLLKVTYCNLLKSMKYVIYPGIVSLLNDGQGVPLEKVGNQGFTVFIAMWGLLAVFLPLWTFMREVHEIYSEFRHSNKMAESQM